MCFIRISFLTNPRRHLHGTGSESDPYLIRSAQDLLNFSQYYSDGSNLTYDEEGNLNRIYLKLTNDINLGELSENWTPICAESNTPLNVDLDGQNHTISGMHVGSLGTAGLFFGLEDSSVKNLTIKDSYIEGLGTIGALAGSIYDNKAPGDTTIENVHSVNNKIIGSSYNIGGLVGDAMSQFTNCSNSGEIVLKNNSLSNVGGIVGLTNDNVTLKDCYNLADIKLDSSVSNDDHGKEVMYIGGLVGNFNYTDSNPHFTIEGDYHGGDITVANGSSVGGLVGNTISNQDINVRDSNNTSKITVNKKVAGIANTDNADSSNEAKVNLLRTFNVGKVTAGNSTDENDAGYFLLSGNSDEGFSIIDSYWL